MTLIGLPSLTMDQNDSERELVERARTGDREAFGELVRMHRARALGWARSLTADTYLAEDIVQEALVRAFLHLGTLADTNRFKPWLRRIVHNQAHMKLRRGGQYGKEKPFAGLANVSDGSSDSWNAECVDWGNVDNILFHLARHASEEARRQGDPETYLLRKETLEGIRLMIHCLNKREKAIFEARFFEELPPSEIAALFNTSLANVYNSLSRSRAKLQKERVRIVISLYVRRRAELGLPRRKVLAPPKL